MSLVLISSPGVCHPCRMTERKLKELGVPFTKHLLTDPGMSEKVEALGIRTLPAVIPETGDAWGGYQPTRLSALVAKESV